MPKIGYENTLVRPSEQQVSLKESNQKPITKVIQSRTLNWFAHIVRVEDSLIGIRERLENRVDL